MRAPAVAGECWLRRASSAAPGARRHEPDAPDGVVDAPVLHVGQDDLHVVGCEGREERRQLVTSLGGKDLISVAALPAPPSLPSAFKRTPLTVSVVAFSEGSLAWS